MTRRRRAVLVAASAVTIAVVAGGVIARFSPTPQTPREAVADRTSPTASPSPTPGAGPTASEETTPPFDRSRRSTTDPASPWVIINKTHPISPSTYAPALTVVGGKEVAQAVAGPLRALLRAAERADAPLQLVSGFRTFGYQRHIYRAELAATGSAAEADAMSARPGHSEHQSGWAVDVDDARDGSCQLDSCFARTAAGRWVAAHAGEFGFLIRYTRADSAVTGYDAEPWHLRYVGRSLVGAMEAAGVSTLEEFFSVPGGDYPGR